MLGSVSEADDAVQESWIRLSRADSAAVENLGGWLTTVVARVCLDMLRSRKSRREEPLGPRVRSRSSAARTGSTPSTRRSSPTPSASRSSSCSRPSTPAERLAFVLHDMFGVPFAEIAPVVGRSPDAARQLASRGRRRVRGAPEPDADLTEQRELVDAFLAAAREGDFEALLAVLDPNIVLRVDRGAFAASLEIHGAENVVAHARHFGGRGARFARPALINGAPGVVIAPNRRAIAVAGFTVAGGKVAEIDVLADPRRLHELDLSAIDD